MDVAGAPDGGSRHGRRRWGGADLALNSSGSLGVGVGDPWRGCDAPCTEKIQGGERRGRDPEGEGYGEGEGQRSSGRSPDGRQAPGSRGAPCSGVVGAGGGVRAAALCSAAGLCMGSWLAAGLRARGLAGPVAEAREEVWWCWSAAGGAEGWLGGEVALGGG